MPSGMDSKTWSIWQKEQWNTKAVNPIINCALQLGQVNIMAQLDSAYQRNILEHNKQTEENRYVLGRLISCIKLCGKCELWDDVRGRHQAAKTLRFCESNFFFLELMDVSMQSARTKFRSFSSMFCCCYLFQLCLLLHIVCHTCATSLIN